MSNKKTKKHLDIHAGRRLEERYGIKYLQHVHDYLISKIRNGKANLIKRQSNRVSIWDIDYPIDGTNTIIRAVYDKERKTFCTFLPRNSKEID